MLRSRIAMFVAAVFILTGCGTSTPASDAPKKDETATEKPAAVEAEADKVDWCKDIKVDSFKGDDTFTAEQYADAYCELITFNGEHGVTELAINRPDDYKAGDIDFLKDSLTPVLFDEVRGKWTQAIENLRAGEFESQPKSDVGLITAIAVNGEGTSFLAPDALTAGRSWSPADYSVNIATGETADEESIFMSLSFTDTFLVQADDERVPVTVDATRKMEFSLSPSGKSADDPHTWLISTYTGSGSSKDPVAVEESELPDL